MKGTEEHNHKEPDSGEINLKRKKDFSSKTVFFYYKIHFVIHARFLNL